MRSSAQIHSETCWKLPASLCAAAVFFIAPAICRGQSLGQVQCTGVASYIYLYSSMTTLDVRDTLQCGQQVEVLGRYDNYFGVKTAKGEVGYVTQDALLLLKAATGAKPALAPTPSGPKDRTFYDQPGQQANAPASAPAAKLIVLPDSTPIRLKITKTLSSADAQVGDTVDFEVSEDVVIDGFLVIAKGAPAAGVVNECETKKLMGRGGKLGVLVNSVRLADNEQANLRSGGEGKGTSSTAGMVIPVMHGKDITFPKGMDFVAYVNGDTRLKPAGFKPAPEVGDAPPTGTVNNLPHP